MPEFESYWKARKARMKPVTVFPREEIPYCPSELKERVYLGNESGWWVLCGTCNQWYTASWDGQMVAHTTDGYKVFGGCCVGGGYAIPGTGRSDRGLLEGEEVHGAADACLIKYGAQDVDCIAGAMHEKRLGPIHEQTLRKALAYVRRVKLEGPAVDCVMDACQALNIDPALEPDASTVA